MAYTSSVSTPTAVKATAPEELNPNQKAFVSRAEQIVTRVVMEVLTTITQASSMKWQDFVATLIDPKQQALKEMDARTSQFFIKMMNAINPALDAVPSLKQSFQIFEIVAQDPQLSKKLVEGIAMPHVKTMMAELDAIAPSIVDDVINT